MTFWKAVTVVGLLATVLPGQERGITLQFWNNPGGTPLNRIDELVGYPDQPFAESILSETRADANMADFYIQRMVGWVVPPASGEYRFFVHADDFAILRLGTGLSASSVRTLVEINVHTSNGAFLERSDQMSEPVDLEAGERYYLELLQYEHAGGDHLGLGWMSPGSSTVTYLTEEETLALQNLPPLAADDFGEVRTGASIRIAVSANDDDPNGSGTIDPGSIRIVDHPIRGVAESVGDGFIRYRSSAHTLATSDQFTYTIADWGGERSSPATVLLSLSRDRRVTPSTINLPESPPALGYTREDAFPPLSFPGVLAVDAEPGTENFFVTRRTGEIWRITPVGDGTFTRSLYADLADHIIISGESGMSSIAFHPNYPMTEHVYLFFTSEIDGQWHNVLARFETAQPDGTLSYDDLVIIFDQDDPHATHNAGDLEFGEDGYLYVSVGDGGGKNDSFNRSQQVDGGLFSGILRLDVDLRPGSLLPNPAPDGLVLMEEPGAPKYRIPPDNPLVGATAFRGQDLNPESIRTEFLAVGLRNPYRFEAGPVIDGRQIFFIGDVGQDSVEELNRMAVELNLEAGSQQRLYNFGWAEFEGSLRVLNSSANPDHFDPPYYEIPHSVGRTVTAGVWYQGDDPVLKNRFIFADFIYGPVSALSDDGDTPVVTPLLDTNGIVDITEDPKTHELLIADIYRGQISRMVPADGVESTLPQTLSESGIFADLSTLEPNPGFELYELIRPFWSDFSEKRRWVTLPDSGAVFAPVSEGGWEAPPGTIWIKHFDLPLDRTSRSDWKRIETRVLVGEQDGRHYGLSYRWNEAGTEATLVPPEGAELDLGVRTGSGLTTQRWIIPSRQQCIACHTSVSGGVLGYTTPQLDRIHTESGENQIDWLYRQGFISAPVESRPLVHSTPGNDAVFLEHRVRSFLAVNCSQCHQPGGPTSADFDFRFATPTRDTGLLDGGSGTWLNEEIPSRSLLVEHVAGRNGARRMPPIGSTEIDSEAIALLEAWIARLDREPPSFDRWQQQTLANQSAADRLPEADPDGDGLINMEEYVLRSSPVDRSGTPILRPSIEAGQSVLYLPRNAGTYFGIWGSNDLSTWYPVPSSVGALAPARDRIERLILNRVGTQGYDFYRATFHVRE